MARVRERVTRTDVMEWQVEQLTSILEELGVEDVGRAMVKLSKLNENGVMEAY